MIQNKIILKRKGKRMLDVRILGYFRFKKPNILIKYVTTYSCFDIKNDLISDGCKNKMN